jgi:hypothetical protein
VRFLCQCVREENTRGLGERFAQIIMVLRDNECRDPHVLGNAILTGPCRQSSAPICLTGTVTVRPKFGQMCARPRMDRQGRVYRRRSGSPGVTARSGIASDVACTGLRG